MAEAGRWRRVAQGVAEAWLRLPLWGAAVGSVGAWFGDHYWLLDLCTHFPLHYVAILLVSAPIAYRLGRRKTAVAALVLSLLNAPAIASELLPVDRPVQVANGPSLRVLNFNMSALNSRPRDVAALARASDADVVGLIETTPESLVVLGEEMKAWPHVWAAPKADYLGLTLYSRHPIVRAELAFFGTSAAPNLVTTLDVEGRELTLLLTHLAPPFGGELTSMRDEHMAEMAAATREMPRPLLVCGDFNATPFSGALQRFVETSGLVDTRIGFGIQGTWPSFARPLAIPIDHCFASTDIEVRGRAVGASTGSDHLPMTLDIVLPSAPTRR